MLGQLATRQLSLGLKLVLLTLCLVVLTLLLLIPKGTASAQDAGTAPITIIGIDEALSKSMTDWELAQTASVIVARSQGNLAVYSFGIRRSDFQRLSTTNPVADLQRFLSGIDPAAAPEHSELYSGMAEAYSYLEAINAPAGSKLLVISSGSVLGDDSSFDGFADLAILYQSEDWTVDVASFSAGTPEAIRSLNKVATSSRGNYFDFSETEGVTDFFGQFAGIESPFLVNGAIVNGISAKSFSVPAYSSSSEVAFFRSDSTTRFTLYDPDGTQIVHNATNYTVLETPNIVLITVDQPAVGEWTVVAEGSGNIALLQEFSNPLTLELFRQGRVAVGEPTTLQVATMLNGEVQPIAEAWVEAVVQSASGEEVVYALWDQGANGDEVADDGVFSANIAPLNSAGAYSAALSLRWPGHDSYILAMDTFTTEYLPIISVERANALQSGEEFRYVAEVTLNGLPYAVAIDEVEAAIVDFPDETILIMPLNANARGASKFEISGRFAPEASVLLVTLTRINYSAAIAELDIPATLYSSPPPAPPPAVIPPSPELPETTATGFTAWDPFNFGLEIPFQYIVALVLAPLLVGLGFVVYRLLRQTPPFGHIYDNEGKKLVDFASLNRSIWNRIFHKSRVPISEIEGLYLPGGIFYFQAQVVSLRYKPTGSEPIGVRVNGRPASSVVHLDSATSLGIGGKLLYFSADNGEQAAPQSLPERPTLGFSSLAAEEPQKDSLNRLEAIRARRAANSKAIKSSNPFTDALRTKRSQRS